MANDAQEWDERYRRPGSWAGSEPSKFLVQSLPLLPRPPRRVALEVASGEGRNALFLASQGFRVIAVERSHVALEKTEATARECGIAVQWARQVRAKSREHAGVTLVESDLEAIALPVGQFDVVLCIKYLQRSLFAPLERALRPQGVLVYETYTLDQLKFSGSGGPRKPEYLLRPSELRDAFRDMEILFYSEICAGKGMASLLARRRQALGAGK